MGLPDRLPLLTAIALFLVCAAVVIRAALAQTDGVVVYALDDAYIHMAMAKNLARHGVWGCTPFHFSSSSSSLLWTLLLGVAYFVFGIHDVTVFVLNIVFGVLALAISNHYLSRFSTPPLLRVSALVALVIAFPMTAMVLMGMEHVLHLLLTIWFAGAATVALMNPVAERLARRRQTAALCGLAALLGASRYEGFFLIGLICVAFAFRRQWSRAVAIGAVALLPVVLYGVVSMANGALFFPNSLMLKAAGESVSPLRVFFKPFGREDLTFYENNRGLVLLVAIGLLAVLAHGIRNRRWQFHALLPVLLAGMIVLHGHFVFSSTYWAYRYDAYLVGFGVFAVAVALADFTRSADGRRPVRTSLVPALAMVALSFAVADPKMGLFAATEIAGARNTYLEHYEAAQFVQRFYSNDAVVVNDIGAVTYFTRARILDLVGLGDMEPLLIRRDTGEYTRDDVRRWTAKYEPTIAIVQLDWSWVAPRIPVEWIQAAEVQVPSHGQRLGFFAIKPADKALLRANVEYHYGVERAAAGFRVY